MALYVYETATGTLVSWCPNDTDPAAPADVLAAKGLEVVFGLPAIDATHAWDEATKTVKEVPAAVLPNIVSTADWIMQFDPAEFAAIRASVDPAVQHFLFALTLAQTINLNNATIQGGIAYLVSVNLLTQGRATALGSWVEV